MGAPFLFEFVIVISPDNHEGKSCVGMFSCVKVLCVTTTIRNITKKILNNVICASFSIQTVAGAVTMTLKPLYRIRNLKTRLYFSSLSVSC